MGVRGDFAQGHQCRTDMQAGGDFTHGRRFRHCTDMQEGSDFAHGRRCQTDMQDGGDLARGRQWRTETSGPATPTLRDAAPQAAPDHRKGSLGLQQQNI